MMGEGRSYNENISLGVAGTRPIDRVVGVGNGLAGVIRPRRLPEYFLQESIAMISHLRQPHSLCLSPTLEVRCILIGPQRVHSSSGRIAANFSASSRI